MRRPLVIQLASLLIAAAIFVLGSSFDVNAGKKCITVGEKSICFDDGKSKKSNDDDDPGKKDGGVNQDEQNKGAADKSGDRACPPGYVVLEKPNKYGAFCEPKEGFCPPDRPNGTPPNCCAEGTTFREGACWPTNCPPGTVGTPPHCQRTCGDGKVLVDQTCYDPCPAGTTGTPPNCFCPAGHDWDVGAKACKERPKCTGGMVGTPPNCKCPPGTVASNGTCRQCEGGTAAINGKCVPLAPPKPAPRKNQSLEEMLNEHYPNRTCRWDGEAPLCDGKCPPDLPHGYPSKDGKGMPPGFGEPCWTGSKVYCCRFGVY